jgi:DNA-binding Lrp family transcriptional regulator
MIPAPHSNALAFDHYERHILIELQANARLTNQELAERVNLSPSACWRRVKALEDAGVILRYAAILDPRKVGFGESVFAHITLARHSAALNREFTDAISRHPEVMECFTTTGEADVLLRVVTPNVPAYDAFLEEAIFTAPGIGQVRSNFALRQVKFETALPIAKP